MYLKKSLSFADIICFNVKIPNLTPSINFRICSCSCDLLSSSPMIFMISNLDYPSKHLPSGLYRCRPKQSMPFS